MAERRYDEALIAALAEGKSIAEVAKTAGVSERTVFRRLADPEFQEKWRKANKEIRNQARSYVANLTWKAASTIGSLLESQSEQVRLRAARTVLEFGSRIRSEEEVEVRLEALEKGLQYFVQERGV
jgi:DNA-binding LacI/PurR family transcriptional regulator